MKALPRAFYERPTLDVLDDIIGKVLVHDTPAGRTAGTIVEAEAYIGESDPACHAAPGPTRRNAPLYGRPGLAYVYLNYGIHSLLNAVTEPEGAPAAVLIRALDPLEGVALMRARRLAIRRGAKRPSVDGARLADALPRESHLCRGPGNLTVAFGITLADNRADLTKSPLRIEDWGIDVGGGRYSPRIGIRVGTDVRWRCAWKDHPSVSGR